MASNLTQGSLIGENHGAGTAVDGLALCKQRPNAQFLSIHVHKRPVFKP